MTFQSIFWRVILIMESESTVAKTITEAPKALGRRERRGIETREKIFRSALDLFGERGFNVTTIEAITDGADIGKGTFFNYFENKESILLQYQEKQAGKVKAFVTESIDSDEPLNSLVFKLAMTMTAAQQKSPTLFQSLTTALFSNENVRTRLAEGLGRGRKLLAKFVETRQRSGEIRSDLPAEEIARSFQAVIWGTMAVWSFAPDRTLEEYLRDMVNIFVEGIQAR